ncbi:MAG: hypothetical protein HYV95_07525 [Opitutae bacterium]|nr:hypothetical protein [Opitutae bacterium]
MIGRFPLPLLVVLAAFLAIPLRAAKSIVIPDTGGRVTLPTTGLAVTLPEQKGTTRKIIGRWNLSDDTTTFWSRDVIDEFDAQDELTTGNWVTIGYFDAGEAAAVVKEVKLTDDWETTTDLWGLHWHVRGGQYEFSGSLGVKPAIVLATTPGKGKPSLLLYHYLIKRPAALSHDEMIAEVKESPTLSAIFQAYWTDQWAPSLPTRSEAVTQPEASLVNRIVALPKTGLRFRFPDDGYAWLHERKPKEGTDMLYRMAPNMPDVTVELLLTDGSGVRSAFTDLGLDKNPWDPAPANLPADWESGPTITTSDGIKETTIGKVIGGKVLIVGFLVNPRLIDTAPYKPLLETLADAVVNPAPLPEPAATK